MELFLKRLGCKKVFSQEGLFFKEPHYNKGLCCNFKSIKAIKGLKNFTL